MSKAVDKNSIVFLYRQPYSKGRILRNGGVLVGVIKKTGLIIVVAIFATSLMFTHESYATVPGVNTLVSVNNSGDGQGGNGNSPHDSNGLDHVVSANGKYVAFTSNASNLVAGDTNGKSDVFVRDLANGVTSRVNVSTAGVQADAGVSLSSGDKVAISRTGRYVVFTSEATNLIDGKTISTPQIYMRDMKTNTTTVVSQTSGGTLANSAEGDVDGVSDDGRFVVWKADLNTNLVSTESNSSSEYVYLTDLKTQTTQVLNHTPATGTYYVAGITMSCDGSLVAFSTKLQLDSSDTDSTQDIYLADLRNGLTITGVTTSSNRSQYSLLPSLSCNGDYMTFASYDTNLINAGPVPSDTNAHQYLYDRVNGTISLADTSSSGVIANNNVVTDNSGVDDQGNTVFFSTGTNLIDGHTVPGAEIYLKHNDTGVTELVSRTPGGVGWAGASSVGGYTSISADGKVTVYKTSTSATTLLSSDTNGYADVIASSTGL
jgi:hypothetical protein